MALRSASALRVVAGLTVVMRRPATALLLCTQLGVINSSYHEPVLFPLIEASGAASGDMISLGRFASASSSTLAAVVNATIGSLQLMAGPTPHKAYCPLENLDFAVGATVLASGDLDGDSVDELVFAGPRGITLIKLQFASERVGTALCAPVTYSQLAAETTMDPASVVVLPFQPGQPQLLAVVSSNDRQPFVLLRYTDETHGLAEGTNGQLEVANRTDFGLPSRGAGWQWRAAAASQQAGGT